MLGVNMIRPTVETTTVSDSGNTLVVLLVTFFLVLAGVALTVVAVWYWRSTIPDPESLGPLHQMSSRRFTSLEPVEQRRALDSLRPSLADVVSDTKVSTSPVEIDVIEPAADEPTIDEPTIDEPNLDVPDNSPVMTDESVERVVDWDDEEWPGDDWSELDALMNDDPEILIDAFEQPPVEVRRAEPRAETGSTSAPIDPLIG
ncbi:MAG: hypothetical protein ACO3GZ_04250 [Ilumatobacteraceae bacterium]